ncbi:ubiquitin-like modifier-activating enzyme 5 [Silene latifolia]|uniref:ubiquitin-like modifier-activating enzyme 5 n=1 Tax=Silene latifolia TaxID=37657 RepID=UPI003D780ED6
MLHWSLLLYDYDTLELAYMNRLFFRPDQVGMPKTNTAFQILSDINPDAVLELLRITEIEQVRTSPWIVSKIRTPSSVCCLFFGLF